MEGDQGKFNFGVDTLRRMSNTLERIKMICELPPTVGRQRLHLDAVKSYFQDASVLMSLKESNEAKLKQYCLEIDNLKLSSRLIRGKIITSYDPGLDKRLFQIIRELGIILQDYYMPKKEYDEDDY